MLYLTRKVGESVVINGNIEVTVVEVRGRSVRLGFTFPPEASVLRREIFERIQEENRAAAESGAALLDALRDGAPPSDASRPGRNEDEPER
jgi:carbon storage regulator